MLSCLGAHLHGEVIQYPPTRSLRLLRRSRSLLRRSHSPPELIHRRHTMRTKPVLPQIPPSRHAIQRLRYRSIEDEERIFDSANLRLRRRKLRLSRLALLPWRSHTIRPPTDVWLPAILHPGIDPTIRRVNHSWPIV